MPRTRTVQIDFQTPGAVAEPEAVEATDKGPKVIRKMEDDLGDYVQGHFSIRVTKEEKNPTTKKMETKVLYENKAEPFEYPRINAYPNVLRHASRFGNNDKVVTMTEDQFDAIGAAIPEAYGPAALRVTRIYNDRLKADAKSAAYNSVQSKHKPLDEEEKEVAWAKAIRNIVRSSAMSAETVIELLRGKVVPEDYTVEDYTATKMRKSKGSDEEDGEE